LDLSSILSSVLTFPGNDTPGDLQPPAPPRQAAADTVRHAGPAIGSAGLILAGTFASLILAGNSILQQIGFAVAAGIALAAFVMAMFFAPSLTALVGNRAWWPGHQADRR
jgi:RND superfamily putative drug exporter